MDVGALPDDEYIFIVKELDPLVKNDLHSSIFVENL